ncbi:MAG: sodium/proline symporter [Pontiellaceae bacterium]|nr:sodium/proline symporter [Pontiellaceae bacterium]
MITASFIVCLLLFAAIGGTSMRHSKKTTDDYLVAGNSISPWLAGLSAVATNNSGFMFIGMIGYTYAYGLESIWLMIGWIVGDLMMSFLTVRKIKEQTEKFGFNSYGSLIADWFGNKNRITRSLASILIVLFLGIYAAAQLKAGSKATIELLHWHPNTGIIIGAVIVLFYSAAGGIRASIWTDAAQAIVMLGGMLLLMITGIHYVGGIDALLDQLGSVSPHFLSLFPQRSVMGIVLFIVGWLFGGIAIIGQPHVVVRFMTLPSVDGVTTMRKYYYGWFTFFYAATIVVGMLARIILKIPTDEIDSELALPRMTIELFSTIPGIGQILIGLILAALFAATMSTADSLVLSCSASVTHDLTAKPIKALWVSKLTTALVVTFATIIALSGSQSIFNLVLDAWAMLGSAFAALLVINVLNYKTTQLFEVLMILTGLTTFIVCNKLGLGAHIYCAAPGILAGFIPFLIAAALGNVRKVN